MIHLVLPLVLALGSALAYATAAAVQRGQTAVGDHTGTWRAFLRTLSRQPRWWAGVATMAVGAGLHVVALGVGSVTLVQPVGALALVLALPIDARLTRRRVARGEWIGAGLVVAGLTALLSVAPRSEQASLPTPGPLLLTIAVAGGAIAGLLLLAGRRRTASSAIARAAGAGLCMGTTSASVHIALDALSAPRPQLTVGLVSGLAALALPVVGLGLLQLAYRDGGLDGPLATLTMLDPVVATTIGITLLGERPVGGVSGVLVASGGGALALSGLAALIRLKPPPSAAIREQGPAPTTTATGHATSTPHRRAPASRRVEDPDRPAT